MNDKGKHHSTVDKVLHQNIRFALIYTNSLHCKTSRHARQTKHAWVESEFSRVFIQYFCSKKPLVYYTCRMSCPIAVIIMMMQETQQKINGLLKEAEQNELLKEAEKVKLSKEVKDEQVKEAENKKNSSDEQANLPDIQQGKSLLLLNS